MTKTRDAINAARKRQRAALNDNIPAHEIVAQLLAEVGAHGMTSGTSDKLAEWAEREAAPSTRTLDEIVGAVRANEPATTEELRRAVVAFDVLLSRLQVDRHFDQLTEYFKAAEAAPKDYAGWDNDPDNPEVVTWYKTMKGVKRADA